MILLPGCCKTLSHTPLSVNYTSVEGNILKRGRKYFQRARGTSNLALGSVPRAEGTLRDQAVLQPQGQPAWRRRGCWFCSQTQAGLPTPASV